jgi:excisionase family DNA binding protein
VPQPELEDSYLTVAEVAEVLKLNQQTVRNWIDQGSLPALRVGRRVRIKRSDFDRILAESYSGGGVRPAPAGPIAEDFGRGGSGGFNDAPPPEAGQARLGEAGQGRPADADQARPAEAGLYVSP